MITSDAPGRRSISQPIGGEAPLLLELPSIRDDLRDRAVFAVRRFPATGYF
jgi:hypothetical protein